MSVPFDSENSLAPAGRWFGIRVVYQEVTPAWTAMAAVKTTLLLFVTVGLSLLWYEPKRFCDVVLYRLDDGSAVARYDYEDSESAIAHVASLKERLVATQVFDFCRELGIALHHVRGEGREAPRDADDIVVEWTELATPHRYQDAV